MFASAARGNSAATVWLFLRAKATIANGRELLGLLQDLLLNVDLPNQERFHQLVLKEKARREAELQYSGAWMADRRLRAHFNLAGWADDEVNSFGSLFRLRRLVQEVESDWPAVLGRLQAIRMALVNRNAMLVNVTLDTAAWAHFRPAVGAFLADLPVASSQHTSWVPSTLPAHEGFATPTQVNYVVKGADLFRLGYTLHGSALANV